MTFEKFSPFCHSPEIIKVDDSFQSLSLSFHRVKKKKKNVFLKREGIQWLGRHVIDLRKNKKCVNKKLFKIFLGIKKII